MDRVEQGRYRFRIVECYYDRGPRKLSQGGVVQLRAPAMNRLIMVFTCYQGSRLGAVAATAPLGNFILFTKYSYFVRIDQPTLNGPHWNSCLRSCLLWPGGIGAHLGRNRLWVRIPAESDIYHIPCSYRAYDYSGPFWVPWEHMV